MYVSNEQSPVFFQALIVRAAMDPSRLKQALSKAVHEINKDQTLTDDVQELRNRLMEAREARNTARQVFEGIGGDDRAARDATDRQAALAELR